VGDVAHHPGKPPEHGGDRKQPGLHQGGFETGERLLERQHRLIQLAELFARADPAHQAAVGVHQGRVLDQTLAEHFEQGVEPPEVDAHHAARRIAVTGPGPAPPLPLPPVALRRRSGGDPEILSHPLDEVGRGAGVGLRRGGCNEIHQETTAGNEQRRRILPAARRGATEEPAGVLQRVSDVPRGPEAHHGRVALDGVEAALHRRE
jgi:hypothetical protein